MVVSEVDPSPLADPRDDFITLVLLGRSRLMCGGHNPCAITVAFKAWWALVKKTLADGATT